MMKNLRLIMIALLIAVVLIGCNSDEGTEQTANENEQENNEPVEEVNEEPEENENTGDMEENSEKEESDEEFSQESKDGVLERYPDDLGVGDTTEFERNDITHDHVKLTVNSFEFVEELNGVKPENDRFLLVNITIENLIDEYNYEAMFIQSHLEDSEGDSVQNEREELELELTPKEGGISTGDIVYDVNESDYYRVHFFDDYFLLFKDEQSSAE
ncbi:DUF4352 domain-containing protein [Gracilibacillus dipsosauri]|uniref:DUF4352 domain-containing protein n=1 Tax=Gracilibacillus dipsosauri TaxID=178340 RepID=A0A317L6R7_9BACI|nr:DUF4352 domain-containing protein [Gracilibacillus dipsosauri]PWU69449.1 hypothetical protein DLJ74_05600 [Gracilibacillus dipsosauri]